MLLRGGSETEEGLNGYLRIESEQIFAKSPKAFRKKHEGKKNARHHHKAVIL